MSTHVHKITHNVLPGTNEYIDEIFVERLADEPQERIFEIFFNESLVIDDMVIQVEVTEGGYYDIDLVYPISNAVLPIITTGSGATTWVLNNSSREANLWYKVPAWTKLKIVTDLEAAGSGLSLTFKICIIGRAG